MSRGLKVFPKMVGYEKVQVHGRISGWEKQRGGNQHKWTWS